jgi:hypothetical protein
LCWADLDYAFVIVAHVAYPFITTCTTERTVVFNVVFHVVSFLS